MKAWRRKTVKGYYESHHVVPKCLGGWESRDNLVRLTAAEHYIAHLLLMKMYPENRKLALPVILMSKNIGIGKKNKLVAKARELAADSHRGRKRSDETRKKMSDAALRSYKLNPERGEAIAKRNRSVVVTDEFRNKMSAIVKGRPSPMTGKNHSEDSKNKIARALTGNQYALGYKHTEEMKARFSEQRKGNKYAEGLRHSDETKKIVSEKSKAYWAKRKAKKELIESCALCQWAAI